MLSEIGELIRAVVADLDRPADSERKTRIWHDPVRKLDYEEEEPARREWQSPSRCTKCWDDGAVTVYLDGVWAKLLCSCERAADLIAEGLSIRSYSEIFAPEASRSPDSTPGVSTYTERDGRLSAAGPDL